MQPHVDFVRLLVAEPLPAQIASEGFLPSVAPPVLVQVGLLAVSLPTHVALKGFLP